ncbi:hypothetical protein [Aquidulcibacter sp.]|uniref:hypothetical protein n=1 Tax=Aquidulcibacter sp. TaxID=2052990 RepID=UPI0025B887DA|nr:hypothetical protein [Aquidulcibacter sp.]MCA3697908.1 hypothetical protein [Aquidulcibacter sp.]
MPDGLIELIFLQVPDGKVESLVCELVQNASIFELSHSELGNLDPKKSELGIISLFRNFEEPYAIFIRSDEIHVGEVQLQKPLIRIIRYEGLNEVAVLFDTLEIKLLSWDDFVDKLYMVAKRLAIQSETLVYCCGLEPGTDKDTQLFSSEGVGPLFRLGFGRAIG